MQTALPFSPLPQPADIVLSRFPMHLAKSLPGPKTRTCLVLFIYDEDHAVEIAYGTSQKVDKIYRGEFLISANDSGFQGTGLLKSTKFDLNNRVIVPFDNIWFSPPMSGKISSPPPKIGRVQLEHHNALLKAWKEAGLP